MRNERNGRMDVNRRDLVFGLGGLVAASARKLATFAARGRSSGLPRR